MLDEGMELGDSHLASPPIPDSWTDFFSTVQADEPLLPTPSLLAHHGVHHQQAVSRLMAPERPTTAQESFSVQDLVQVQL